MVSLTVAGFDSPANLFFLPEGGSAVVTSSPGAVASEVLLFFDFALVGGTSPAFVAYERFFGTTSSATLGGHDLKCCLRGHDLDSCLSGDGLGGCLSRRARR